MSIVSVLGYAGGIVTTLGGVPQIVQMVKTKKTKDVSWGMLCLWVSGLSMTFIYAVCVSQPPVYLSASASLLMTVIMGGIKYHCERELYTPEREIAYETTST